jgi:hypothetical protein
MIGLTMSFVGLYMFSGLSDKISTLVVYKEKVSDDGDNESGFGSSDVSTPLNLFNLY